MKMTLNKTWIECLRMWKWIAEVWKKGNLVGDLKRQWLREHDYKKISLSCFFCEYDINPPRDLESAAIGLTNGGCSHCPGCFVDPGFTCDHADYAWDYKPKAFYAKLVQLNKKRLEKK